MEGFGRREGPDSGDVTLGILLLTLLSVFVLRSRAPSEPEPPPFASGSAGMDMLWRDSVRPLKEGRDLRAASDPAIVWDEELPEEPHYAPAAPAEEPGPPARPEPEPPARTFPTPIAPEPETPFERPRLQPSRLSFAERSGSQSSSAFLAAPSGPREEERARRPGRPARRAAPPAGRESREWRSLTGP